MALKQLEDLQLWFLRLLLRQGQGPGVPTASLLWESSLLSMDMRIWREKTCLILHLRGLDDDSLGKRIWEEQRRFNWPGLARETSSISKKLIIDDPNTTKMTKSEYRKEVTKACHQYQEVQLKAKMKNKEGETMKKCLKIEQDLYGRKAYFDNKVPHQVRSFFATKVGMLPIAGNFRQDRRFARTGWLCRCEGEREEERHLTDNCPLYRDIRAQFSNLEDDDQLVEFFQLMLKRRDQIDEQEKEQRSKRRREGAEGGDKEQLQD